jgi:hypothetical protein
MLPIGWELAEKRPISIAVCEMTLETMRLFSVRGWGLLGEMWLIFEQGVGGVLVGGQLFVYISTVCACRDIGSAVRAEPYFQSTQIMDMYTNKKACRDGQAF